MLISSLYSLVVSIFPYCSFLNLALAKSYLYLIPETLAFCVLGYVHLCTLLCTFTQCPVLIWLTRGSHLHVTCEAFVTRIKIYDIVKSVLDHLIAWFSVVQRSNCSHEFFILQFGGYLDPLTVVTYMSPVEVFATAIKMFDQQNVCLITWSFPSEALDSLIFRVKGQIAAILLFCYSATSVAEFLIFCYSAILLFCYSAIPLLCYLSGRIFLNSAILLLCSHLNSN